MAEPTTTSTTLAGFAAAGVSVASLLPGMDGNAIVGAFAGAALMALHARDLGIPKRLMYLAISWIAGYLAAPEVAKRFDLQQTGVAAFLAAALIVAVTVQLLDRVGSIDLTRVFRRGGP